MGVKVTYDGAGFYACRCEYIEREIPRKAGFRWDAARKIWSTPSAAAAARLREYADELAKKQIDRSALVVSPWRGPLPTAPEGRELKPFQVEALLFALGRNRAYLGLDPGLGKTIVAAMLAQAIGGPVVYICPPFLARNVEEEFATWAPSLRVARYGAEHDPADPCDVLIVPDSVIARENVAHAAIDFGADGTLIVDEAHRFKNSDAKRSNVLYLLLIDKFTRVYFMSGTPMPNRPMELYPVLKWLAPGTIDDMTQFDFGRRYCAGHHNGFGWDFSGFSNMKELAARVIAPSGPFMLRMKKKLLDLPPKLEELVVLGAGMSATLVKMNSGLLEKFSPEDLMARALATAKNDGEELHLATYRRLLGVEKVAASVEYLKSILEETSESVLIFAVHKDVIRALEQAFSDYRPFVITGETPMAKRHEQVKEFQLDPRRRVFIGNIQAMGVGFTLTKATRVVFVEFSWVPGENDQASDRAHRIGQREPVLVQYLVFKNSIDKAVVETLLGKRKSMAHI